jgi:2-keto-4-pentenoate hydratase/2-oxohepta-3-ene-1,7-dioic acid hydratase in catechol pathway
MRRIARWAAAGLLSLPAAALALSWVVSRPLYDERLDPVTLDEVAIAPPEKALTFARAVVDGRPHVLLVALYRGGRVIGVDLNRRFKTGEYNPAALFNRHGYDALLNETTSIADTMSLDAAQLDVPVDAPEQNIGVGLSYREHAEESALDEPPFLFPKFAQPGRWNSDLAKQQSALLDYEAELGLVALEDLRGPAPNPQYLGLVLCNEATDRWLLIRNFKRSAPMGTTGFADGKSRQGFAPIGPLLVIPRDIESFYKEIETRLYLNGRLRQHGRTAELQWPPRETLNQIYRHAEQPYRYGSREVLLLGSGVTIPAGTVVFSGTPAGVLFKPLNFWNPWLYLRPGDEVAIRSDFLGVIRNRVVD